MSAAGSTAALEGIFSLLEERLRSVVREELRLISPGDTPSTTELGLLSLEGAAEFTSLSKQTIAKWLKKGWLKRYGEGRTTRVSTAELLAFMAKRSSAPVPDDGDDDAFAAGLVAAKAKKK